MEAFTRNGESPLRYLNRHWRGEWGDLDEDDKAENEYAIGKHLRILSKYHLKDGTQFYLITEADRSVTTFLLVTEIRTRLRHMPSAADKRRRQKVT
jgi:hypothetical protein